MKKYELVISNKFKKGLERAVKRGLDISLMDEVVEKLLHVFRLKGNIRIIRLKANLKASESAIYSRIGYWCI